MNFLCRFVVHKLTWAKYFKPVRTYFSQAVINLLQFPIKS